MLTETHVTPVLESRLAVESLEGKVLERRHDG
jgi:hypothetical protein